MEKKGKGKKGGCCLFLQIAFCVFVVLLLIGLFLPPTQSITRAQLVQAITMARQIQIAVESQTLKDIETEKGPGHYPSDIGAKTSLEYITHLVNRGVLKEEDLRIVCKSGRNITALKDLRSEDIAFRFANVSRTDAPETAFIVSRNVVEESSREGYLAKGYIVIHRGGDGNFMSKMPPDPKIIGPLPPREPQFLEP